MRENTISVEIDSTWSIFLVLGLTIALLAFGIIGRSLTPEGNKILSWQEWQILKAQKTYEAERNHLRQSVQTLSNLLNQPADPVRVQIATDAILRALAKGGESSLVAQREAVSKAAQAVYVWGIGRGERDEAAMLVQNASEQLQDKERGQ